MIPFIIFFLILVSWWIRTDKIILFYLYLWQLKEYHIGRFLDHFRTAQGRKLIFNKLVLLKLGLLLVFGWFWLFKWTEELYYFYFSFLGLNILLLVYLVEAGKALKNFFQEKLKKPVLTKKVVLLISAGFLVEVAAVVLFYIYTSGIFAFVFFLLVFDLLTPLIVSLIVLLFQPFAVLIRNKIIKQAIEKRRQYKDLLAIGITGSYGKTSTKEILAQILSEKFNVLKTEKNQNSETGISRCILDNLNESCQIFIAEMGAYRKGGIKLLCDIVKPRIGILTGINEQHMALFGSQEKIIKTKFELVECLPRDGAVIFNMDNDFIRSKIGSSDFKLEVKEKKMCSRREKFDIWAENIRMEKEWIFCRIFSKDGDSADFKINLLGMQNLENILLAVCCAKELGMNLREISDACLKIKPGQGAMKILETKTGLNIVDSAYSSNPNGVMADLDYLKVWKGGKVIVMPCLIELGSASKEVHRKIGKKIAEICDLAIITTKERFEDIKQGAVERGMKAKNILFIEDPKEIIEKIKDFCGREDIILFEGRVPKEIIENLLK